MHSSWAQKIKWWGGGKKLKIIQLWFNLYSSLTSRAAMVCNPPPQHTHQFQFHSYRSWSVPFPWMWVCDLHSYFSVEWHGCRSCCSCSCLLVLSPPGVLSSIFCSSTVCARFSPEFLVWMHTLKTTMSSGQIFTCFSGHSLHLSSLSISPLSPSLLSLSISLSLYYSYFFGLNIN